MRHIFGYIVCFSLLLCGCGTDEEGAKCSPACASGLVCQAGQCVPQGASGSPADPTPGTPDPTPGTPDPTPGTPTDPTPGTPDPTPGLGSSCGASVCLAGELCLNGQCVQRDNKAVAGQPCNAQTFVESCDGNQLVYCYCDESGTCQTEVAACGTSETCALMADKNLGMCAIADAKCAQPGTFTRCFDLEGGVSYVEYYTCAQAVDGKYYPFRDGIRTADCIGACVDSYRCNLNDEDCGSDFSETCEGDIVTYCSEGKVFRMNCGDYGTTCVMSGGKADCAWE